LQQLQQQALGQETPASRFLESRLQQAARQAQQAEAATSTRQRLGRQSAIARQQDIGARTEQTLADLLGQLQLGAQQQYGQLMGQLGGMRAGMAQAEMGAQQRTMQTIGAVIDDIMSEYAKEKEATGVTDDWLEQMANFVQGEVQQLALPTGAQPVTLTPRPTTPVEERSLYPRQAGARDYTTLLGQLNR
jgi:hypothetical protein